MRNLYIKISFILCALLLSVNSAWGGTVTLKVTAESSPKKGGYVYINKEKKAPSKYELTEDWAQHEGTSIKIPILGYTTVSQDFYFYAKTNEGYTFSGWTKNSSDSSGDTSNPMKVTLSGKNSETKTDGPYYAIFTPKTYTVKFYRIPGNTNDQVGTATVTYDATYGSGPGWINSTTRTGYTFAGWYMSDGTTKVESSTIVKLTGNLALYAHWTPNNYTVTLNSDLATSHGTTSLAVTYDSNTNLTSAISTPSRTDWTFWGYYTKENGKGTQLIDRNGNVLASVSGYTDTERNWKYANNVTLYAYLTEKSSQTITWDLTPDAEYATGTPMGATASSGLAVTYSSNHPEWGYINENGRLVVVEPNKTIAITASQSGNDYYKAATPVTKTIVTLGANPNQYTDVHASNITYGDLLSASTLSGKVYLNDVEIAGTLSWVDPSIMPNAGTANHMVLFTPDNTATYSSVYFEVPVTVAKANPVITWNIGTILREEVRYDNFVASSNKESGLSIIVSNTTLLNVSGTTLRTGSVESKVTGLTITVNQAASANYNSATSNRTVAIYPKAGVCLPFDTITEDQYNHAKVAQDGSVAWCNTNEDGHQDDYIWFFDVAYTQHKGIALGSWEAGLEGLNIAAIIVLIKNGKFDYSPKSVDLFFSGIPDRISFDVETQVVTSTPPDANWNATQKNWYLYESEDGENYTLLKSFNSDSESSVDLALNENTRYVRITYAGNFTGFVENLRITQKKYLREKNNKSELVFGTEANPLQQPQVLTLSYSSLGLCGGTDDAITVTSNNPAFYVDETTITENVGIELKGEYVVRVRCNDVNQTGILTFRSNDGTELKINVRSTNPYITTAATSIFETGTEYASVSTPYRAQRTHDFSACFDGAKAKFDYLYIYGVSESSAANRQWIYDASKGYKVPAVSTSNVHTPCFIYKKDGARYTYVSTFDAATTTLNIADGDSRVLVGYRPAGPAATAIQLAADAKVALNNTEILASGAVMAINGNATVSANGENIISSASNAAIQLSGATTLTIEDSWKAGEASAILALRPATGYPSINLGSAEGAVVVNGTQLELHNGTHLAIAHMAGAEEQFDGEVHINDGSVGGETTLGMPKRTFIDGGTFNDGTVAAYTLKGVAKRPRNSRGEMLSRYTMTKAALEAYDYYGQAHLTLDGAAKVNPMLMDEDVWIFNGADGEDYSDEYSWNKDGLPTEDDDVLINAPMVIAGGEMKVKSLTINWENKGKGIPAVTVNPDGGLTVGEGGIDAIKLANPVENLVLKAGETGETKGQTGFLRIHPNSAEPMPEATVELYSIGYYDYENRTGKSAMWQYVGSPLASTNQLAKTVYKKSWVYGWDEATDEWYNQRPTLKLTPFVGFATTQRTYAEGMMLTYVGQIVSSETNVNIPLSYSGKGHGENVLANSFVAPIDITKFEDADFRNIDSTIYIFNTGSRQQEEAAKMTKDINAPGQYLAIPIGSARLLKGKFSLPTVIAPMQGFCMHAIGENAMINLNYEKLVWEGDYVSNPNTPMRVKANNLNENSEYVGALRISIEANGWVDHLYIIESEQFDRKYEGGFDARKRMGEEMNLFAVENDNQLSVDATNSIIGTHVGVRTGEETMYTFFFSHLNSEKELALFDWETEQVTEITENTEYTFFAEPNRTITDRFEIIEWDGSNKPGVATGVDNVENGSKVHKFIKDNQLFILKNGVLYNATGVLVR